MKCVFCSKPQELGKGLIFVFNDGKVIYFCSSKCRKNYRLGRDPKKIKWAKKAEKRERNLAFEKKHEAKSEAKKAKA